MLESTSRWSALLLLALAGCGNGAGSESDEPDFLAPPPAGQGVQLRMVSTIAPGEEHERCQFFVMPPGGLNLHREAVRWLEGSHHVVLYSTTYSSVPKVDLQGREVDTSGVFDCSDGVLGAWDIAGFVAAAQDPDAPDVILPENVAIKVPAGSVVLMNTHYLNTTSDPLETDTRINLYSIPDADVKTEAGVLTFYDPFILVPENGSSSSRMRCPVPNDLSLVSVTSHMHRRGVHFEAGLVGASGTMQDTLFETDRWADVPIRQFEKPRLVQAGSAIDFHCDFENAGNKAVAQGPTTQDEMCVMLGIYYPRDTGFEACSSLGISRPGHDAIWYGDGDRTCLQAVQCMSAAKDAATFYGCVVDSCPASGPALSALIHCQDDATHGPDSACAASCQPDSDPAACQQCVVKSCGSQVSSCVSATCDEP